MCEKGKWDQELLGWELVQGESVAGLPEIGGDRAKEAVAET